MSKTEPSNSSSKSKSKRNGQATTGKKLGIFRKIVLLVGILKILVVWIRNSHSISIFFQQGWDWQKRLVTQVCGPQFESLLIEVSTFSVWMYLDRSYMWESKKIFMFMKTWTMKSMSISSHAISLPSIFSFHQIYLFILLKNHIRHIHIPTL